MRKTIVVAVCIASLLLQGCWTTNVKDNPLYGDCSSFHNQYSTAGLGTHYVTVVSASGGRCYGSGGDSVAKAKDEAMRKCRNFNHSDCTVYAEDKKVVLKPTIKDRDMDWGSTMAVLGGLLVGATAYEAGKASGTTGYTPTPVYTPPSTYTRPSTASSIGTLPKPASNPLPSPGTSSYSTSGGASQASGSRETQVPNMHHCVSYEPIHGPAWNDVASWFKFTNRCGETVVINWCDITKQGQCAYPSGFNSAMELSPGKSDKSWFSRDRYKGISYLACPDKFQGKKVHARYAGGGKGHCFYYN